MNQKFKWLKGGITAPKGFLAGGIHCGLRKNKSKKDVALILSRQPASTACVYTQNKVKGAPILVTQANLQDNKAQAVIVNSGNANTCNANGIQVATDMCKLAGDALGLKPADIVVASTGVIGQPLDITPIQDNIKKLVSSLTAIGLGSTAACDAIMTTDTKRKEFACQFYLGETKVRIGAIAKGSGMIHPNMATMLSFVTTDADIDEVLLKKLIKDVADDTFNMVSVDGDTSTNDMLCIMANGMSNNQKITSEKSDDYVIFKAALLLICKQISRALAKDGEGATKLLECEVTSAPTKQTAKKIAKSIITSSLFKSAMFGEDANWGRILCAIGYTDAKFDVDTIDVTLASDNGELLVCKDGSGVDFSEEKAKEVLSCDEIKINVSLNQGKATAMAWGCDLTYDYVKINGDYRT